MQTINFPYNGPFFRKWLSSILASRKARYNFYWYGSKCNSSDKFGEKHNTKFYYTLFMSLKAKHVDDFSLCIYFTHFMQTVQKNISLFSISFKNMHWIFALGDNYRQVKVKLPISVINYTPCQEVVWKGRGTDPCIINLSTRSEWSTSRPGCCTHWIGDSMDPRDNSDTVKNRKTCPPLQEMNSDS
jgi:hypothetical protein